MARVFVGAGAACWPDVGAIEFRLCWRCGSPWAPLSSIALALSLPRPIVPFMSETDVWCISFRSSGVESVPPLAVVQLWLTSCVISPNSAHIRPRSGQIWPILGRTWRNLAGVSSNIGRTRATCCRLWAEVGKTRPRSVQNRPNLRPRIGAFGPKCCPKGLELARVRMMMKRPRPTPARFSPTSAKCGPNSTGFGPMSAKSGAISAKRRRRKETR